MNIPPRNDRAGEPLLVLGFGGNAWNAKDVAAYLHGLFPEVEVVAFHYLGDQRPPVLGPQHGLRRVIKKPAHIRAAIQEDITGRLLSMLIGAMEELLIGDPLDYSTDIGPVIGEEASAVSH